jgi:hypothetical protein
VVVVGAADVVVVVVDEDDEPAALAMAAPPPTRAPVSAIVVRKGLILCIVHLLSRSLGPSRDRVGAL